MHVHVTGQAYRILVKDARRMRSLMALSALRFVFVFCMVTTGAIDLCVLAHRLLPFTVNGSMAYAA